MLIRNAAASAVIAISLAACYTPIDVKQKAAGTTIGTEWEDGVPFYLPTQIVRRFKLTKFEKDGEIIGKAPEDCDEVPGEEYFTVANYDKLYMIRSHDFFFGQNEFGVTLNNGILGSVNSKRDPQVDEMVNAVVGAAKTAATLAAEPAAKAKPGLKPDCNAGKRYDPLPKP